MSLSVDEVAKVATAGAVEGGPARAGRPSRGSSIRSSITSPSFRSSTRRDVEPLAHGIEVRNVFRDDVRGPALDREKALANAPERNQVGFLVPAVLE